MSMIKSTDYEWKLPILYAECTEATAQLNTHSIDTSIDTVIRLSVSWYVWLCVLVVCISFQFSNLKLKF